MKIRPVFLLRCLLLVVVGCSVLFVAKASSPSFDIPVIHEASSSPSDIIWRNLMELLDVSDDEDCPMDEEDTCDEKDHPEYLFESRKLHVTPASTHLKLPAFRVNNVEFFAQAEPDYQPKPPKP